VISGIPKPGSRWVHSNGNKYTVILIANLNSCNVDYPPTVVYIGGSGIIYAKVVSNFLSKLTEEK